MEVFGDAPRSTASSGGSSPRHAPGFRFPWSPRLLLLELFASFRFRCGCFRFCSSCACLVSSGTAASRMLTVALALRAEWKFSFGRSSSSVSGLLPASLMDGWCGSLGACLPFFPLPFPLESLSLHGSWSGGCRGSSHRVVSSCSFLRLACLRSGGGRLGWQSLAGPYVLRDVCLVPVRVSSSPLTLRGVVLTSPVCLSRAPAFRQVRVAMLAEGSYESPSILVLAFHSSLFLVEGSSNGSVPGDRFLSPGRLCLFTPFSVEISRFGAVSPGVMGFSSPLVGQFTVGYGGTFPRGNCSEFP